jgi:hypothetical protein
MIESFNRRIANLSIAAIVMLSIVLMPIYANSANSAVHHRDMHLNDINSGEHANTIESAAVSDCEKNSSDRSENGDDACCEVGCTTIEVFALVYASSGFIPALDHEQLSAGALVARHSFDLMRPPRN